MGKKSIPVTLNDGIKIGLRLTLAGQKAMKRLDPDGSVIQNILAALDDPDAMGELLTQCLNWEGNENTIHNGEDLYDALVDSGVVGTEEFGKLILDICRGSGLLSQSDIDRVKRILTKGSRLISKNLEEIGADEDEAPTGQEDPSDPLGMHTLDG